MMSPLLYLAGNLEELLNSVIAQDTRLIELHLSADSGVPDSKLRVHRISGCEAINEAFRFEAEVFSADPFIELKDLEGIPIQITLLTDRGSKREINGVIMAGRSEGSDGSPSGCEGCTWNPQSTGASLMVARWASIPSPSSMKTSIVSPAWLYGNTATA